jgi:SAM-dependent methyltransferase
MSDGSYDPKRYWDERFSQYGLDIRGPGNRGLSERENLRMYDAAAGVFEEVCRLEAVDFPSARVLEIGVGNGYYGELLSRYGVTRYLGVDITDVLFEELRRERPDFVLRRMDVSSEPLDGEYDLVLMIDVTQHIVDDGRFAYAMRNVRSALAPGGVFVVTSWLDPSAKDSYYEKSRGIDAYTRAFDGLRIGQPVPFRDKFLFTIKKDR